jgi:hypothetical protein
MADAWGFWGTKSFSFWDILIFLKKTAKTPISVLKISFWRFSQKVSILEFILLHNITYKYGHCEHFAPPKKSLRPLGTKINKFWYLVKQKMGAATFHRFQLWVWSNDLTCIQRRPGEGQRRTTHGKSASKPPILAAFVKELSTRNSNATLYYILFLFLFLGTRPLHARMHSSYVQSTISMC